MDIRGGRPEEKNYEYTYEYTNIRKIWEAESIPEKWK